MAYDIFFDTERLARAMNDAKHQGCPAVYFIEKEKSEKRAIAATKRGFKRRCEEGTILITVWQ